MPHVHFVKKARKADRNAGIKKGDSYYWWKFRFGGKNKSKSKPKQSQLTRSEFWGNIFGLQEDHEKPPEYDDLESTVEEIKSQLEEWRDEQEERRSNMPDALQDSETGELLQERYDALDSAVSDLDGVGDFEIDEDEDKPEGAESDEDKEERLQGLKDARREEVWESVTSVLENISCG